MGLQSQLNDVGSDSIPILLVALIASCLSHIRSVLAAFCHSLPRLHHHLHPHIHIDDPRFVHLGSGLASLIAIADHRFSLPAFRFSPQDETDDDAAPKCVICFDPLTSGDWVRRVPCNHIFHQVCLDGWLDQMAFICPLCRSPLLPDWRPDQADQRIAGELAAWFAVR